MEIGKVHMTVVVAGALLVGSVGGAQLAHTQNDRVRIQCMEDEVAVHGGFERYYDPRADLECAHLDDMFTRYWREWGYDGTYDPIAPREPWAQDWKE